MAIDLDSFLESFEDKKIDKKTEEKLVKEPEKVNLDFQKDVEDKITSVSKNIDSKDFKFLENMYNEIKKFEGDLPNKFLGIKATGDEALKKNL